MKDRKEIIETLAIMLANTIRYEGEMNAARREQMKVKRNTIREVAAAFGCCIDVVERYNEMVNRPF
jgi:hypothetical protein